MKSLWSKAGRAQRCRCRSYSTAVTGLGRRVTAAPRRKATFAEIFTACYSSVFASAAIIDAVGKEQRRQDLDRQLDEARRDLAQLREQSDYDDLNVESNLAWLTDSQMEQLWESLKDIWLSRPYMKEIHQPARLSTSELRVKLQLEHYNVLRRGHTGMAAVRDLNHLERAVIFEESERSIPRRDPYELRHLEWFSQSMRTMVKKIMADATHLARQRRQLSHCPSFKEAQELVEEGYPHYKPRRVDPEAAQRTLTNLNRVNRKVLGQDNMRELERIGRMCYNLLISPYAPDIHSFNTLIVAFDSFTGYRRLANHIIYCLISRTYMIPSPSTYAAILRHEKLTGNHLRFLRTISSMVGLDGYDVGGKVRRRDVDSAGQSPWLQDWAADTKKRTISGDYVYEHAPLNRLTVEETLRGLLHFHMYDAAVSLFASCVRAGVQMSVRIVKQILDDCLYTLDWSAGVRLIRELTKRTDMWSSMLASCDDAATAYLVDRIYSMLDMIGLDISGPPLSDTGLANLGITASGLAELHDSIVRSNLSLPPALVVDSRRGGKMLSDSERASRSRLLQLASIEKECIRVRKTTKSIESKLANEFHFSMDFCVSMVEHIGAHTLEDGQRLMARISDILETSHLESSSLDALETLSMDDDSKIPTWHIEEQHSSVSAMHSTKSRRTPAVPAFRQTSYDFRELWRRPERNLWQEAGQ